jgi:ABC-type multidrug transport system fused ATPase/permease subunit
MPARKRHAQSTPATAPSVVSKLDLLIGDRRPLVYLLACISVASGIAEALLIALIAQVAADLANGKALHQKTALFHITAPVGTLLWVTIALAIVRLVLQWPMSVLPARIAADVQLGLRSRLFRSFTTASWEVQSRDREGTLQETMTNQANQATGGALQATSLLSTAIVAIILMATAIVLSPLAAGIVFVVGAGMFFLMRPLRDLGNRRARELSSAQVRYAGAVAEANRLAEESHVFGVMDAQHARIIGFARRSRDLFYRTQMLLKAVPNAYQSMIFLMLVLGLAVLYELGTHHQGRLLAIVLLLVRASQQGQTLQAAYQGLQQSLPFIDRLSAAERRYAESTLVSGEREVSEVRTLAFEDVGFSYVPGRQVLSEVSFSVGAGEAIGIVGPSGAGKSTLVQILLQLRHPQEGLYLLNGNDVREFSRTDWHRLVAYVPQEPRLLHASVADNIRFFRDLDAESVRRAAELARIHEDIEGFSRGYETIVGPRADAVSGGQQQRICLARALAARPQVLVLDEPTSALDPQSETLIQESLLALKHELTLFTIAHRMSTLDMCDRVMVIVDGRLTAFDTKAALQQHNHYYRTASLIAASATGGALP